MCAQSQMSSALNPALEVDGCKNWEEMCWVRSLLTFAEGQVGGGVKAGRPYTRAGSELSCTASRLALDNVRDSEDCERRDVPSVIQSGVILVRGIGCGVGHGARRVWSLPTPQFAFWTISESKLERQKGGWSPARLSVGGMAPGGAVMGSVARGCSSLQGGDSKSRNMAHWRQIVTGSLGARWVSTEPPPGCFC